MSLPLESRIDTVVQRDGLLIALVPPLGFRSEWAALSGYLKIASYYSFEIETSELVILDASGNEIEVRHAAFGLGSKTKLAGPYSHKFSDHPRRPANAAVFCWRINDLSVRTGLVSDETASLRVIYLPLQVGIERDPHIIVTVVNRTAGMLNFAEGVRTAVCIADGKRFTSTRGGHWDGGTAIQPRKASTVRFSLDDFPGIPRTGCYEMQFEILGHVSELELVEWKDATR